MNAPNFRLNPSYGAFFFSATASTAIASGGTFVKAGGTTTEMEASNDLDAGNDTDNRLLYEGATERMFKVDVSLELTPAGGTDQDFEVALYKYDASAGSGSIVAGTKVAQNAAATEEVAVSTSGIVKLDTGDYVEVHVTNRDGTNNVTVNQGVLSAMGVEL